MKVWIVSVGNCEDSGGALLCATKEIAVRELFKARDRLIAEWQESDKWMQKSNAQYYKAKNSPIKEENNMYKGMIKALEGNDYTKWDNYPHDCPYLYQTELLDK